MQRKLPVWASRWSNVSWGEHLCGLSYRWPECNRQASVNEVSGKTLVVSWDRGFWLTLRASSYEELVR